jgi:hypothetical protein
MDRQAIQETVLFLYRNVGISDQIIMMSPCFLLTLDFKPVTWHMF